MDEASRPLTTSFTEGAKSNTTYSESTTSITSMDIFSPSGATFSEIEGEPEVQREIDPSDSLSSIFWSHYNHPVSFTDINWDGTLEGLSLVWDNSPVISDVKPESISDSMGESLPDSPASALTEYSGTETVYTEV